VVRQLPSNPAESITMFDELHMLQGDFLIPVNVLSCSFISMCCKMHSADTDLRSLLRGLL